MPSYVTLAPSRFSGGVAANLTTDQLAILNTEPGAWHRFAESLMPALEGYQSSPLNNTKAEKTIFVELRDRLAEVTTPVQIADLLNGLLVRTCQAAGEPGHVRLRTATLHLVIRARWSGLALLPATGCFRTSLAPWLASSSGVRLPDPPLPFHKAITTSVLRSAREFGIPEQDRGVLRKQLVWMLASTDIPSISSLGNDFYEAFWDFAAQTILPTYGSKKELPTAYTRARALFDRIFEFLYVHEAEMGRSALGPPCASGVHFRKQRNADSLVDVSFDWWLKERPEMIDWVKAFSWYVHATPRKQPRYLVGRLKKFCLYLNSLNEPPQSPREVKRSHISRRVDSPKQTFIEFLEARGDDERQTGYAAVITLRTFFERWQDAFGNDLPNWSNPVREHDTDNTWVRGGLGQKTNKEILPVRLIKLLKTILTSDDYAWPKSLREDTLTWYDTEMGCYTEVWCPTRAIGLLTLLTIPIRSLQLRLLDSGEADEFVADLATGEWVRNGGLLAAHGRQVGFVQRIYDAATHKDFLGLRISTNKTGVVTSAEFERPYDIPWQCEELLPHIRYMRDWQATYNPVRRMLSRRDLSDAGLHPSGVVKQLPNYCFLFRDPANGLAAKDEPVSGARMRSIMLKALEEAERRLREEGEDVTLVSREPHGGLSSPYTLHGLRASGITHFVEAGVPIQVIAEFLAGHAIILTTLHYTKPGASHITGILDRAVAALDDGREEDFLEALRTAKGEDLSGLVVSNGGDGVRLLADTSPGTWSSGLDGICPTGRSLCHIGGERISSHNNAYYAPVPGGPRNCARCRFFITGPAFLAGQVVVFNNLVFAVSEKAKDLDRLKKKVIEAEANGLKGRRLERERTNVDALEIEINDMLKTLQARYLLIERSRALLREGQGGGKHQLITLGGQGEWDLILEQTSDWDLIEFVAQACEVFPEKAEPSAPLRKGKILDRFLKANGYQPLFYALPDDEALAAGNRMTRFLQERVGRDRLRSLMDGHATLRSLGIAADFEVAAARLVKAEKMSIDPSPARRLALT